MSTEPDPVGRFGGALLMAVGGLITALCGTCTVVLIGSGVFDALQHGIRPAGLVGSSILVLIVGGVPTGVGVLLLVLGWRLVRPRRPVSRAQTAVFSDEEERR